MQKPKGEPSSRQIKSEVNLERCRASFDLDVEATQVVFLSLLFFFSPSPWSFLVVNELEMGTEKQNGNQLISFFPLETNLVIERTALLVRQLPFVAYKKKKEKITSLRFCSVSTPFRLKFPKSFREMH